MSKLSGTVQTLTPLFLPLHEKADFTQTPIAAIFVLHDPRDWGLDIQVMCDVIRSEGVIGCPMMMSDGGGGNRVELVFFNRDLLWRNDFEVPRLAQGAFLTSFQAVYKVRKCPSPRIRISVFYWNIGPVSVSHRLVIPISTVRQTDRGNIQIC